MKVDPSMSERSKLGSSARVLVALIDRKLKVLGAQHAIGATKMAFDVLEPEYVAMNARLRG